MPKMLIVHGGAPTAVINASLYGAVKEAKCSGKVDRILGAVHGTAGILNEQFTDLGGLSDEMMEKLRFSPASAIGTSRTPLEDRDYEKMASVLKKNDIVYVLFTGGNGSMDTCRKLSSVCADQALIVGGIPKTIDNDLDLTDHAPGYGSAALCAARSMEEIAMDVRSLPIHVCIVEYMGRNSGWITAASTLARKQSGDAPHIILIPEVPFEEEKFLSEVKRIWEQGHGVMVAVSEGIRYTDGTPVAPPVFESGRAVYFGAVSQHLSKLVIEKLGIKARFETPGILGRSCAELTSSVDRDEAVRMGALAARTVLSGKSGFMSGLRRISDDPYQCEEILIPVEQLVLHERLFPNEFISENELDVNDAFLRWCRPLLGQEMRDFVRLI